MSLRAYSRHKGCALNAVQKAIKAGRIVRGEDGLVDSEAADVAWAANTNVAKAPPAEKPEPPAAEPPLLSGEVITAPPGLSPGPQWPEWPDWKPAEVKPGAPPGNVINGDSFMAARTRLAWLDVAEREAEFAAQRGETIEAAAVRKWLREIGRIYGRGRAAAASEITPQVLGLTDPNEVERRILRGLLAIDERIANEIAAQYTALVGDHDERGGTGS
jgi:hypothetical protein